jgi:hypothetical protein
MDADGIDISLADLPDDVIVLICVALMASGPLALIFTAPNFCHRWRVVCRDQVPLELLDYDELDWTHTVPYRPTISCQGS